VLIYFPFKFSELMEYMQKNSIDEFNEKAQKMMVEIYGTDKI